MSEPIVDEKGKIEATGIPTSEEEKADDLVDKTEYPTGYRFWGVVVALVMSILLVGHPAASIFCSKGTDLVAPGFLGSGAQ